MPKARVSSITTSTNFHYQHELLPEQLLALVLVGRRRPGRSRSRSGTEPIRHHRRRPLARAFGAAWPWRSLSDRLPIPLADRGEHVEHQATGGASGVDLLADGEQRGL